MFDTTQCVPLGPVQMKLSYLNPVQVMQLPDVGLSNQRGFQQECFLNVTKLSGLAMCLLNECGVFLRFLWLIKSMEWKEPGL